MNPRPRAMRAVLSFLSALGVASAQAPTTAAPRVAELSLRSAIEQALARNFDVRVDQQQGLLAQAQLESAQAAYVPTVSLRSQWERADDPIRSTSGGLLGYTRTNTATFTGGVGALLPTGGSLDFSFNLAESGERDRLSGGSTSFYDSARGTLGVVSLTQPIFRGLRTDSTRLTIRQRKLEVRSAQLTSLESAISTVAAVEQAYYQLVAARETVKVREAALSLAQRTVADTVARRQIGTVPPLEERQAQASAATAEADLISARQTVRERENALKLLISDNFSDLREAELAPTDALSSVSPTLDYAASVQHALAERPELGQLGLTVSQRELSVAYQRDQRLPQVDLVGSYGLSGSDTTSGRVLSQWGDRDYPAYTAGIQISFPWTNRKARSDLQSAEVQKRQAELRLEQQRDTIRSQVDVAISGVKTSYERIGATRRAREYAEAALDAEQAKLNAGESTTFNVLQLQRDLTSARASELAALAEYNTALSTLRLREASSLEHWQISFDSTSKTAPARNTP